MIPVTSYTVTRYVFYDRYVASPRAFSACSAHGDGHGNTNSLVHPARGNLINRRNQHHLSDQWFFWRRPTRPGCRDIFYIVLAPTSAKTRKLSVRAVAPPLGRHALLHNAAPRGLPRARPLRPVRSLLGRAWGLPMIRGAGAASGGWPLGAAFVSGLSPSEDTRQETLVLRGAIIAS